MRNRRELIEHAIRSNKRAALIVNTRSRRGAECFLEAKQRLLEGGISLEVADQIKERNRLVEAVRQAINQGIDLIIVGGGDGTIHSIVRLLAYADVALGILPLGTANNYARAVGIPLGLAGAVDTIASGAVAEVDLGRVNDHYFINGASIGLPAMVAQATSPTLKSWLGRLAYAIVAAAQLILHKPFRVSINTANRDWTFLAVDIWIGKGGYEGGMPVAPEARLDSGALTVRIITGESKWMLLKEWSATALGLISDGRQRQILQADSFTLDSNPKQEVSIDGEYSIQTPINVAVARKAMLLMVPRS